MAATVRSSPPTTRVILDEAHLVEDVATQYFGVQVSSYRVEELTRDVERELKAAVARRARGARSEVASVRMRARASVRPAGPRPRDNASPPTGSRTRATEEALALLQRLEGLRTALLAHPRPARDDQRASPAAR